jgi:hypothetical protein
MRAAHWSGNVVLPVLSFQNSIDKSYLHIVINVGKTAVIPSKLLRRGFFVSCPFQTIIFLNFELS